MILHHPTEGINKMSKKFWLVWSPQGRAPTYQHDTMMSAANEAERLAKQCPGAQFHVLEMIGTVNQITVAWSFPDKNSPLALEREIPF